MKLGSRRLRLPGRRLKSPLGRMRVYYKTLPTSRSRKSGKGLSNIPNHTLSKVETSNGKKYAAVINWARYNKHALAHMRADIFAHEHGRPRLQDYFFSQRNVIEEQLTIPWPKGDDHIPNILDPNVFLRFKRKKVSFDTVLEQLKNVSTELRFDHRVSEEDLQKHIFGHIRHALASNFPTRTDLMRAMILLYNSPRMKPVLDELDSLRSYGTLMEWTPKIARLWARLIIFMKKQSEKAQNRYNRYFFKKGRE